MKRRKFSLSTFCIFTAGFLLLFNARGAGDAEQTGLDLSEPDYFPPLPPQPVAGAEITPSPSPSPSPSASPGAKSLPSPTSSPSGLGRKWVPPEDIFNAFGPGRRLSVKGNVFDESDESKEITLTKSDGSTRVYREYPEETFSPHKKTVAYSLLDEAYKTVFQQIFGIELTTPTPASTPETPPSPTPAEYKTPVPTPALSPTPTRTPSPAPTGSASPTSSPTPSTTPSPTPTPEDFVAALYVGYPMWSVYADDKYIYGGSNNGNIYLWERESLGNAVPLNGGSGSMYSVFSMQTTSGKFLFGANQDNKVYVWEYNFMEGYFTDFTELQQGGSKYSVCAEAGRVYGAGADDNIYVWRKETNDFSLQTVLSSAGDIYSVYSDGGYIYGANYDHSLYLWDQESFAYQTTLSQATDIMWSVNADSYYIYGGSADSEVYVWNRSIDFPFQTALSWGTDEIYSVCSDDRAYLYGASADSNIYVWERSFFSQTEILYGGTDVMNCVYADRYSIGDDFTHYIFGANDDGYIYVWRAARTPTPTPTPTTTPTPTSTPTPTPEGYHTPTPTPTPTSTPTVTVTATATPVGYKTPSPTPSPSGGSLLTEATPPPDFSLLAVLTEGKEWMNGVFADEDYIYGANEDRMIYVWNRKDFSFNRQLFFPNSGLMLSVFADRDYVYGASDDSHLYVWNRGDFSFKSMLNAGGSYAEAVFADDDYIYVASADGSIYIWERATFAPLRVLDDPRGWLTSVYADEERIYGGTGGKEYNLYVWDRALFSLQATLSGPISDLNGVSADARYIYGGSADGNLYVWDQDFNLREVLTAGRKQVSGVAETDEYLYGANHAGRIYIWQKPDFSNSYQLSVKGEPFQAVYADEELILGAGRDSNIYVWRAPAPGRSFASSTPVSQGYYPPVPPSSTSTTGAVVNEFLSVNNNKDYYGGIALKDGYLYENISKSNSLYQRDPDDGTVVGQIKGLQTAKDMGIAWDEDNECWFIADPWYLGISKFREENPAEYDFSVHPRGNVCGISYDPVNKQLLSANNVQDYVNVWSYDGGETLQLVEQIYVGFTQGGVVRVGDKLWAGLIRDDPPYPVYELNPDGSKTGRQFELPEGRQAWDMDWDGEYLWVRSNYAHGNLKIYQIDIDQSSDASVTPAPETAASPGERSPASGGGQTTVSASSAPTPSAYQLPQETKDYQPYKKTIDYSLLQQTYKKVYEELFGIILTTPTPPPTPIPTPTAEAEPTGSPSGEEDVVINEINPYGTLQEPTTGQWIELYNNGDGSANLNGWSIEEQSIALWTINIDEDLTINAGGYIVLTRGSDPTGGKVDFQYDSSKGFSAGGGKLVLKNSSGSTQDTADFSGGWLDDSAVGISIERIDPSGSGSSNWNAAPASSTYNGGNQGTPGEKNSSQVSGSGTLGGAASGRSFSLSDYADWIDFETGKYFKLFEWDLTGRHEKYSLYDFLPNIAFLYLVTGYQPCADYFRTKLLAMVRDTSFDWGGEETCRYIADLAEAYLAMEVEGKFSSKEREEIEDKFSELAIKSRRNYNTGNYAQGIVCGLNAAVGYIIGGEKGKEMISWANRLLSYDDTWTLPEDSRHYQGLFIREMLRVALYSNQMTIPDRDEWGIEWKENFALQIDWILDTFPHNGFCPAYGREYRQNHIDHYMMPLAVATSVLDDGNPQHLRLAREAKWLLQKMFEYGTDHEVSAYGQNSYGYEAVQWGPFAILLNPVYLWWYLNEDITPLAPTAKEHGSQVVYRELMPEGAIAGVYDEKAGDLKNQPDKIIHRSSWGDEALFLMLDPAWPAAKNGENKYSFANNIVSLSYGPEEFLTGLTLNFQNGDKGRVNVSDIMEDYTGAEITDWEDNPRYSRSVTTLKDTNLSWRREVTLHKGDDPYLEIKDTLSRPGSVYWHLQGEPTWKEKGVILEVNGTSLEVSWDGVDHAGHRVFDTWSDPQPLNRWTYSGNPDQELSLTRYYPGTITTTFRGVEK